MARLLRLLVLLAVWGLWSLPASATQCTQYATRTQTDTSLTATGWKSSRAEACEAARASVVASNPNSTATYVANPDYGSAPYSCRISNSSYYDMTVFVEGYATRTGDYCSACLFPSGTVQTRNVTYGFSGTPPVPGGTGYLQFLPDGSPNTAGGVPNPPQQACINQCRFDLQSESGDVWASTMPTASGHYRLSRDVSYTSSGLECSPTSGDQSRFDLTYSPPTCAGSSGYINGKKVCLPSVPDSGMKFPTGAYKEGNPKAGSQPIEEPVSRLPAGGNGGNGGGPAGQRDGVTVFPGGVVLQPSASSPASATKTATAGEEQVACGAPGQPKCALDETGTPSNRDLKLDEATIDTQAQVNRNTAGGSSDKGMFSSWSSFFVTPTVGTCGPLQLPGALSQSGVVIDPCPVVDGMRSVVGFLWALGGFWLCLGWIREVM